MSGVKLNGINKSFINQLVDCEEKDACVELS